MKKKSLFHIFIFERFNILQSYPAFELYYQFRKYRRYLLSLFFGKYHIKGLQILLNN
jgi:hypothetical protein